MSCQKSSASWRRLIASTALTGLIFSTLPGAAGAADPEIPADLRGKLESLTPEQRDFIDDPEQLRRFKLTREKLYNQLGMKDEAGVQAYVSALMSTVEAAKYQPYEGPEDPERSPLDPAGDMAAVPLNLEAGNFNSGTVLRPAILDQYKRQPGPFSLHRYVGQTDGVPTFANAPVAIRKEDLVAGKVEVAFVGVPQSLSSGWRDARNAPGVMRSMYGIGGYDTFGGVDPTVELTVADYGDLSVDRMSADMSIDHIRMMIADMVDAGVVPFIVGGDHSVMFPTVAAMADNYGADEVTVVHLDAHYNGERDLDNLYSDKQSVSRLIEEGLLEGENLVQVGLRGIDMDTAALTWMQDQGIRYHTMAEIEQDGWDKVMKQVIKDTKGGPDNVFISFDISVLDPAHARGAGRPMPMGLTMREVVPVIRRLCAETKVVGFEMLDVAPFLDLSYQTALNANYIMHACLTGIAMRKTGADDAGYLNPMAVDNGQ